MMRKMIGLSAGIHLLALPWVAEWLTNPPPAKREVKVSLRVTPMSPAVQASTGVRKSRKQSRRAKQPLPAPRVAKATPQALDSNPPARLIPPSRVKKEEARHRAPAHRKQPVPAVARARKQPAHRPPEAPTQSPPVVAVSKTEAPPPVSKPTKSLPDVAVSKTEAPPPVSKKRTAIAQPSVSLVRPHPKKKPSKGISPVRPPRATLGQSIGSGGPPKFRFLRQTKPTYPTKSKRREEEGDVILRIEILPTGGVGRVEVAESSGHELLDRAARQSARAWRFEFLDKKPDRSFWATIPFRFKLEDAK